MLQLFSTPDLRDSSRDTTQTKTSRRAKRSSRNASTHSTGARTSSSTSLRIRRLACCALVMMFITAAVWIFLLSDIAKPITEPIKPYWNDLAAMINDPMGVDWGAKLVGAATLLMGHLGLLAILDDRFK